MNENEFCMNCKFGKFPERGRMFEFALGYCHRYAPKPVTRKYLEDIDDLQAVIQAFWPIISQTDFCGEFSNAIRLTPLALDAALPPAGDGTEPAAAPLNPNG